MLGEQVETKAWRQSVREDALTLKESVPFWTRPARPRRCFALLLAMKVSVSRLIWRFSSNLE